MVRAMRTLRVLGATTTLAFAALAVPAAVAATTTARYTITDLGALGTGDFSVATAINNAGQVVGWAGAGLSQLAVRWQGTSDDRRFLMALAGPA